MNKKDERCCSDIKEASSISSSYFFDFYFFSHLLTADGGYT
jgi:hypothetical protein